MSRFCQSRRPRIASSIERGSKMSIARVELTVLGQSVAVEGAAPEGSVHVDELLPFLYAVDNAIIDVAVKTVEAQGKTVSCCKGCSACCRAQPVPITPPEAFAIARLVGSLPEPRRS